MQNFVESVRKCLTLLTWALILVVGVAVPVLERAEIVAEPAVESEHNPATCPPAHDHTLCTQVSAELIASGDKGSRDVLSGIVASVPRPVPPRRGGRTPLRENPSRAPPRLV